MSISRLVTILAIFFAVTLAWFTLGATLTYRSQRASSQLGKEVRQVWGPGLTQPHLTLLADGRTGLGQEALLPAASRIDIHLEYAPKKRGLVWHRTYDARFRARYELANTGDSPRNVRIQFALPSRDTGYDNFTFQLEGGTTTEISPHDGMIETVVLLPANSTLPLTLGYDARGLDRWAYAFPANSRVKNFTLAMTTNFDDISFPASATSPTERQPQARGEGWRLTWEYKDALDARDIAMDMPRLLNAGPIIARITFFAPLSLAFFFGVLVVTGILRGSSLHPMTYAFLAAGFFTFHLLLAYLGDILPLHASFVLSAMISMLLVGGYLRAVAGREITVTAAVAQFAYMVLCSYSFFFDGLTGLTLTIAGVATLALLMAATAGVNWDTVLGNASFPWPRKPGVPAGS